jgi:hypothetical protein
LFLMRIMGRRFFKREAILIGNHININKIGGIRIWGVAQRPYAINQVQSPPNGNEKISTIGRKTNVDGAREGGRGKLT